MEITRWPQQALGWFLEGATRIDVTSFVLGVLGFAIAICQIRQAKSSADAAKNAAENAKKRIAEVIEVVTLEQLIKQAHRLADSVQSKKWTAATGIAFELQAAMAKVPAISDSRGPNAGPLDLTLLQEAVHVYEQLGRVSSIGKVDHEEKTRLSHRIGKISVGLSRLAGEAIAKVTTVAKE